MCVYQCVVRQCRHAPPLPAIDPIHGKRRLPGIGPPFLGIDIRQIRHAKRVAFDAQNIRRHVGGTDQDGLRPDVGDRPLHPIRQAPVAVESDAERLAGEQTRKAGDFLLPPVDLREMRRCTERADGADMLQIERIVHQASQMDVMALAQMPQNLQRTDLLALYRGIGNALGQEKKIRHRPYARSRLMKGEIVLATATGSFRQAAITLA